ncbi:hypothetical protein GYV61_02795 [Lactobacillus melliventris]|nr:hypothetical protein [Lactobacillus melliventris]
MYTRKCKRYGQKVLKNVHLVKTYGDDIRIYHKLYYIVGKNQYVKKANF